MRVLLSAYACEPDRGSEPEVGWQRALHMTAFADEVWVLTRANNKKVIEANPLSQNSGLRFLYYDLPLWAMKLKKRAWFFYIYLVLWQWGAYRLASRQHRNRPFDCVYHVTFAGMLAGSFMGRLGIPFIVGPVAGGERAPFALRRSMPVLCRLKELLRDLAIVYQRYSPLTRLAFAAAERIYVTTPDSLRLVRPKWHFKTEVRPAIAIDGPARPITARQRDARCRFVFAGNLLHLKGVHFSIRAMAEVRRKVPAATLTLIGSGPQEGWLRDTARRCGVADAVEFIGSVPRQQLINSFQSYTALVFPSLHDSGGMVVLEALSEGLPVICLDLGGPGIIVNGSCGIVVPTADADEANIVTGIANAMISFASMPAAEWARLSSGAIVRANEFTWSRLTERIATSRGRKTA
jgi:glycosyltransferase involved in cell wall biosynthesis